MDLDIEIKKISSVYLMALIIAACLVCLNCPLEPGFAQSEPESDSASHKLQVSNRPKVGLVLGGGGARGAAHVGALRILEQEDIPIDFIVGTNVGAVVGGLYSAGVSIDSLEEMFTKKSLMRSYLTIPIKLRIMAIPALYLPRLIGAKTYDGLYRGNRFRNFLNKYVPQSEQDLEDLKIPFGAVALDLIQGKEEVIRSGNLGQALQASSAIPILRKPVKIQDKLYVDGGVVSNLPVREARAMGADLVIAIDLDTPKKNLSDKEFSAIGSVAQRVITLHLTNIDRSQAQQADIVIKPKVGNIGLMSTSQPDAREAIQAGERASLDAIEKIRQLLARYESKH